MDASAKKIQRQKEAYTEVVGRTEAVEQKNAEPDSPQFTVIEAIYFDTTVLRQLSHGAADANPHLLEIQDMSAKTEADFFVPEIVFKEWIQLQSDDLLQGLQRLESLSNKLDRILGGFTLDYQRPQEIEQTITRACSEYLDALEIGRIPIPENVRLEDLVERSVRRVLPFQEGDKGFKDTIVLLTVTDHMVLNGLEGAMLVSGDKVFTQREVLNGLQNRGLNLLIATDLHDARQKMRAQLDALSKAIFDKKRETARAFLEAKFDQIARFVLENAKVSRLFLRGAFERKKTDIVPGSIKAVIRVNPLRISEVYPGVLPSKAKLEEGAEPVTFTVCTEFELLASRITDSDVFRQPRFSLSTPEEFARLAFRTTTPAEDRIKVERDIGVEAFMSRKGPEDPSLRLLRVITY